MVCYIRIYGLKIGVTGVLGVFQPGFFVFVAGCALLASAAAVRRLVSSSERTRLYIGLLAKSYESMMGHRCERVRCCTIIAFARGAAGFACVQNAVSRESLDIKPGKLPHYPLQGSYTSVATHLTRLSSRRLM
jgi:hypothetical protein